VPYRDRLDLPCPRCGVPLARYEQRDKWKCPQCVGVLLGEGELAVDAPGLLEPDDAAANGPPCPVCAKQMQPILAEDVELDRCVADRVVWFDSAELGLVIERAHEAHEREVILTRRSQPLGLLLRIFEPVKTS
jgi:Zn-finger nucleic acid-binding protein